MSDDVQPVELTMVSDIVRRAPDGIAQAWLAKLTAATSDGVSEAAHEPNWQRHALDLFRRFVAVFGTPGHDGEGHADFIELTALLKDMAGRRAVRGLSPLGAMDYPLAFKAVVLERLQQADADTANRPGSELLRFDAAIDRLVRRTVEAFLASRDDLIGRQSRAILELSTPVVTLWDSILLLPVVGVIDTARAQQMVERLLETICQVEARVAILDITGVPVIDTRVARHLLLTIDAARMLGAETIMTGISPEAAMTLTSLGIDLSRVRTKGSLRAGVAEALRLVGKSIVTV